MLGRRAFLMMAVATGAATAGCRRRRQTPEDIVRQAVGALESSVEGGDTAALRDLISERFASETLGDRAAALAMLGAARARHPHIHLLTRVVSVDVESAGRALASVAVAAAGHPIAGVEELARVSADLLTFDLVFGKESPSVWRVTSAAWRQGQLQDFLAP